MATESVLIVGNTYRVKEQLKSLGGRWDAKENGWLVPAEKANAARELVAGTSPQEKWEAHAKAFNKKSDYQKMVFLSCL